MATQRSVSDKINDTRTAFNVFQSELTSDVMRSVLGNMTGAQMAEAAQAGDVQAYAALVEASLSLQRVVSANDRAALIAAAMVTQSGVSRPVLEVVE